MPTRFYGRNSSYVHGGLDSSGKLAEAVYGQAVGARTLLITHKMSVQYLNLLENTQVLDYLKLITNTYKTTSAIILSMHFFDFVLCFFASLRKSTRR